MTDAADEYRRGQRRRAIVAWVSAALVVVVIVLAAALGGDGDERANVVYPVGFAMTAAQYESLETGLEEGEFFARLEQTGAAEDLTGANLVDLFPAHDPDLTCTYWQIVDEAGVLARVCFDGDGRLSEKLERSRYEEPSPGLTA
jgi:hypothetical protein